MLYFVYLKKSGTKYGKVEVSMAGEVFFKKKPLPKMIGGAFEKYDFLCYKA
ncbi:hypothetical protein [Pontibacter mangrovi]|uniref:hypothetical protein n=1 Tax=Pontibacter mangrovi TaxID=2589816 RepID=UPI0015E44BD1|nr:hypothetical protein [Pontibacter mangrovi]